MNEAVVVTALRSPIGRAHPEKGCFRGIRSDDLAVQVIRELVRQSGVDPGQIEELILGCATQTGEQAMNVARYVALMAGLPYEVGAQTINRQCASSMTALHSAAQAIRGGYGEAFIAGGLESMTHLPEGTGADLNPRRFDFAHPSAASMGLTAENLAQRYGISREEQEAFALRSHGRAVMAQREGKFTAEIVPIRLPDKNGSSEVVDRDQNPRPETSLEIMAALPALTYEGGTVTVATASPTGDGAAALLVLWQEKAQELGLRPLARVVSMAVAGVDPQLMGLGAVSAARKALKRAGLRPEDMDLVEINEAFAAVALACIRDLGLDPERVNPNGGALALGHPMGASGARLAVTLLHEMERCGARYGLATMCVGMGQGVATIFEREGS
ncbi:MAG: thiolase family protein [Chloroflexota bacterium]|nr:thiolase family protein [Chloroflexota bacterium]